LRRSEIISLQRLSAREFTICEHEPCGRAFKLCVGLGEPYLVRARVDGEERIAFVDYISVLETYPRERAADLGAQLDLFDC
jgi:hypothetical protein